jgi:hypothetical protein
LPSYSTKIVPTSGKWKLMVVGAQVPEKLNDKAVKTLMLVPIVDSFQDGDVYIDDVSLYKLQ